MAIVHARPNPSLHLAFASRLRRLAPASATWAATRAPVVAMTKLKEFDPSAYLTNDEVVAEYLTAALEDPNPDVFLVAVGNVAKARGTSSIAEE